MLGNQKMYTTKMGNYTLYSRKDSKENMKKEAKKLNIIEPKAYVQVMINNYRNFTYFKDWETALKSLSYDNDGKRYIYELIMSDRMCRPHIDIEKEYNEDNKPTEEYMERYVDEIKKNIMKIFKKDYNKELTETEIKVIDSSGLVKKTINNEVKIVYKLSYHITITTKGIQLLYKTNMNKGTSSAYHLAYRLIELYPELNESIDSKIYTKDREMRCIWSYKKSDDDRFLKPLENKNNKYEKNDIDYLITGYNESQPYELLETPIMNVKNNKKIKEIKQKEIKKTLEKSTTLVENKITQIELKKRDMFIELKKRDMFIELLNVLSIERIDNYQSWLHLIFLCKTYNCYEEIIDLSKKSEKYNTKAENIINNIFKADKKIEKEITIGSLIKWSRDDNYIKTINILENYNMSKKLELKRTDEYLLYNIASSRFDHIEDNKYISEDAIKKIYNKISGVCIKHEDLIIILHAPTGVGKTIANKKIINYYLVQNKDAKILSLVSRQTMVCNYKNAFEEYKMIAYLDEDITDQNRFISSMEHLSKIYDEQYDVLIMDEIQSLLKHVWSATMDGRRLAAFIKFAKVVKNAKIILASDANITNMVLSFIDKFSKPIYYYKNIVKNKTGVIMNIYRTEAKENDKLYAFCKIMKHDIINKKSVLIFSDTKNILIKIRELLRDYCEDDDYFMYINKDYGSLETITQCNHTFLNKCVLISPKMIYGNDITIQYDNIYCIYKYTNVSKYMTGLEYHQQYSRARNVKSVHILALESKEIKNNYISYEQSKEEDIEEYKLDQNGEKYKILNELCTCVTQNGITINQDALFIDVYFYKSWYDKLFKNKIELSCKMSEEAGYKIINHKLEVIEICEKIGLRLKNTIKIYNGEIRDATKLILSKNGKTNKDINNKSTNILANQIKHKIISFGDNLNEDQILELIIDNKKYTTYLNKKYLNMSKEIFDEYLTKISHIEIDSKIIKKIKALCWLEDTFQIKRYEIDNIQIKDLNKITKILFDNMNKLIILYDDNTSKPKLIERMKRKIEKITDDIYLKKFCCDIYNIFGNVIKYESKYEKIKINNKYVYKPSYVYSINNKDD